MNLNVPKYPIKSFLAITFRSNPICPRQILSFPVVSVANLVAMARPLLPVIAVTLGITKTVCS